MKTPVVVKKIKVKAKIKDDAPKTKFDNICKIVLILGVIYTIIVVAIDAFFISITEDIFYNVLMVAFSGSLTGVIWWIIARICE